MSCPKCQNWAKVTEVCFVPTVFCGLFNKRSQQEDLTAFPQPLFLAV